MHRDWFENKLDNALFNVLNNWSDENKIQGLISQGANINAIDRNGDSLLINVISNIEAGEDYKAIQILIDLGVDLNYTTEGFNCLFGAFLTWYPELVELLLKAGANPNCISTESPESLLDWVDSDKYFQERQELPTLSAVVEIVKLLKDYGAKTLAEIFEENQGMEWKKIGDEIKNQNI